MTKVLIVATYPIKNAQHGGQRRVSAIVKEYKKVFQQVKFVSVFSPDYYRHHGTHDIAVKGKVREQVRNSPYTGDVICGQSIYTDAYVKNKMTKLLKSFMPDIIQIEQVFPYLGLKPLLEELNIHPKIILSSHNIEYSHKKSILENSAYSEQSHSVTRIIEECERDLAQRAEAVIAVSEDDSKELIALGAKRVAVAPNGIAKLTLTQNAVSYWRSLKEERGLTRLATFVGSAHPPNWRGFEAMIGNRLGFLPSTASIVLAGSISDYFCESYNQLRPEHITFWCRTLPAGRLSDASLAGLIEESDVILLPITEGGGSNLKTAEAILSGRKIVATSYAFRSFERYLSLPNIYIADTPDDFRKAVLTAFEIDYKPRTKKQEELAKEVQWHHCLVPMIREVSTL